MTEPTLPINLPDPDDPPCTEDRVITACFTHYRTLHNRPPTVAEFWDWATKEHHP